MRGGRGLLLALLMLVPFAVADSIHVPDPLGDERTISATQTYDDQPNPISCHDASIDIAGVRIDRSAVVRVTYSFHGPIAAPLLTCNDHPMPATDRTWNLNLYANVEFFATATSGSGAPTVGCVKASNPGIGNSASCLASVSITSDGFWFELPTTGTFTYEGGQPGSYNLGNRLTSHPTAWSRLTAGMSPMQRVVFGASDFSIATLG